MSGPREAVDGRRVRGGDLDGLGVQALDDARLRARDAGQALQRFVEIGQRGRQSPHLDRRPCAAHRASASSTCTPRLLDISSCHSSTMTVDTCARRSRQSARASISVRLSGVVTSAVGSRLFCRARADDAVSPVRTSTVQCGCSALRRARERQAGVGGQRAQRRDPQHGQRRRRIFVAGGRRAPAARSMPHASCPCRWARARGRCRRSQRPPRLPPGTGTASSPARRTSRGRRETRPRLSCSQAWSRSVAAIANNCPCDFARLNFFARAILVGASSYNSLPSMQGRTAP